MQTTNTFTKNDLLSGKSFTLPNQVNERDTFKLTDDGEVVIREFRRKTGELLFTDYMGNIEKLGRTQMTVYTYFFDKRVTKKIKFEDMIEFIES
jgi:glycosylphosphatidylinositol transamidase (GPIT) subunit GPI8